MLVKKFTDTLMCKSYLLIHFYYVVFFLQLQTVMRHRVSIDDCNTYGYFLAQKRHQDSCEHLAAIKGNIFFRVTDRLLIPQ